MAIQDQTQGGLGIRRLTEEERARVASQQVEYQRQLAARQAAEQQQFQQTQAVGLANQAGTPGAPAAVVPPVVQPVDVPATTSVVPPAPAPTPARGLTNAQVLDKDRANLAAFTGSQPGAAGTTLSPDVLADANQRIAQTLAASRTVGPQPGAESGDFSIATTSRVGPGGQITSTLRQPENIIQGGYGGFGAGGNQSENAREFLTRMEAQDALQRARTGERRREIAADVERIGLRNATTQGSATDRAAARRALATFEAQQGAQSERRLQEAGATERAGLAAQAEQARAGVTGAAAVQAAMARAAGTQEAAQIAAGATTEAARLRAAGLQGAAQVTAASPQAQLAGSRAELIQEQLRLQRQAEAAGDVAGAQTALGITPPRITPVLDPLTNQPRGYVDASGRFVLYTPAQLEQIRLAFQPTQE